MGGVLWASRVFSQFFLPQAHFSPSSWHLINKTSFCPCCRGKSSHCLRAHCVPTPLELETARGHAPWSSFLVVETAYTEPTEVTVFR